MLSLRTTPRCLGILMVACFTMCSPTYQPKAPESKGQGDVGVCRSTCWKSDTQSCSTVPGCQIQSACGATPNICETISDAESCAWTANCEWDSEFHRGCTFSSSDGPGECSQRSVEECTALKGCSLEPVCGSQADCSQYSGKACTGVPGCGLY